MDEDVNLNAALLAVAEDVRRALAGHPSPEELLDYHLGTLDPEDRERLRDHLTLCAACADAVLDFAVFPDLEPPVGTPASPEHEMAQDWRRLSAKLEAAQTLRRPPAGPARESGRLAWVLAASFFAATLGLALHVVQLRQASDPSEPRTDVVFMSLAPREEEPVRGAPESVGVPAWADRVVLVLSLGDLRGFPSYRLEMTGSTAGTIWTAADVHRAENGTFTIELDRRTLPPDRYRIVLSGAGGEEPSLLATYDFVIEHD